VLVCSQTRSAGVLAGSLIAWGLFKGLYDANIFASIFDVIPAEARGTAAGVMNMIGWLCGGGLAPVAVGYLSQSVGLSRAIGFTAGVYVLGGLVLLLASRLARRETVLDVVAQTSDAPGAERPRF
jgi:sugar phosphate permease